MIRRLVHISDIHIPSDPEKHRALRDIFQNFFHLLDEVVSQESMILICGDLLHNKEIISPEQIMLARQFLEQCGKRCQTVLIAGNHDLNMFRKDRLDSLTPCCSGIPNVSYLSETGVRIFDNVAIVVNSLVLNSYNYETDTVDPLKSNDFLTHEAVSTSVQGYISVCLYHGIIDGSKAPNGYNLSSLTKKCHLQGFDYVLLGDVHRHQFLAPNIAYSGSLWQQNHGEDIGDHGMIIWDLEKRVGEFRRVPNPCAYYTYYFDKPFDKVVADLAGKNSVHVRLFFDPKKGSVLRTVASLKSGKHADVSTETRFSFVSYFYSFVTA
jgi:exonuclease SbcD